MRALLMNIVESATLRATWVRIPIAPQTMLRRIVQPTLLRLTLLAFALIILMIGLPRACGAYSVLTHEEVVDLLWKDDIQPLLVKRFPDDES